MNVDVRSATVLLIEDDEAIRYLIRTVLEQSSFQVLQAAGGIEGLAVAGRHPGPIHLLVSDMMLPELSGYDVARKLLAERPDLRILFISGILEDETIAHFNAELGASFLGKPFSTKALVAKVREVLASPPRKARTLHG